MIAATIAKRLSVKVIAAVFALVITAAPALAQDMQERTEQVELRLSRDDGQNVWAAGPWNGTFSFGGRSSRLFGVRSSDIARASLTVNGPGFEDGQVSIDCDGGQLDFSISFITFDHQDLAYTCTFSRNGEPIDSRLELALSSSGLFRGLGRAERAGAARHGGQTVNFETRRLSGGRLPTGRVPGYVIRDGEYEIGGMDYRVMRPLFFLPPEGDPKREIVLLTALILATFTDSANSGN